MRNDFLSLMLRLISGFYSIFGFIRYISLISSLEARAYRASFILTAKASPYFSSSVFIVVFVSPFPIS
jgi:hypothetical protein